MSWPPKVWTDAVVLASELLEYLRDPLIDLSSHVHNGAAGQGDDELSGVDKITFDDVAASPTAAGELQRNGVNLEWYGTSKVAITETDAAAATASPRTLGSGALQGAPGDHGHTSTSFTTSLEAPATAAGVGDDGQGVGRGQWTIPSGGSVDAYDETTTKKIGAICAMFIGVGQDVTVDILADGVSLTSFTSAGSGQCIGLLALKVKATADIRFIIRMSKSGAGDGVAQICRMEQYTYAPGTGSTTPSVRLSQADLGAA